MRVRIAGTAAVAALTLGLCAGQATAATDRTAPVLNLPASAEFVSGGTIGDAAAPGSDVNYWTFGIPMRASWTATDPSGICGYDISVVDAAGQTHGVVTNSQATSYQEATDDYNGDQGGGSLEIYAWKVTAHDCAGNSTTKITRSRPTVHQEDGRAYEGQTIGLAYTGAWTRSVCSCWSGDADRNSRVAGAKATITQNWTAGQSVALVMEKAPDRGVATVLVDGVPKATVDTYATAPTHRAVTWTYRMPAGAHSIDIVNAGTAGRSRIDLDAVLVG